MDASRIDIFEIYRRFSEIKSGHAFVIGEEGYRQDSEFQKAKVSRDALTQLSKLVESRVCSGSVYYNLWFWYIGKNEGMLELNPGSLFRSHAWIFCALHLLSALKLCFYRNKFLFLLHSGGSTFLWLSLSCLSQCYFCTRATIFDELSMLMSRLGLMTTLSEFSRFYEFVFFMCRENGQKNITVSKAVTAWKLVLNGRFPLLHPWCEFIEKNQRYNISEDTWQQVLSFSLCTRDNLDAYDPEGAWPILIDDFVEHMYRQPGSYYENSNFRCNCGDPESLSIPGRKSFAGLKRKLAEEARKDDMDYSYLSEEMNSSNCKRSRSHDISDCEEDIPQGNNTFEECMDTSRQSSPLCSSKSQCAVEGCLSKGFAGLLSTSSYVQFGRERRASFR